MLDRSTLQEQTYAYLKKEILGGSLRSEEIYSEKNFGDILGVSRTPVREAVFKLRQEGLLESIPGRGFRIKKLTCKDIIDFYEMRSAVEGHCAYLLALRRPGKEKNTIIAKLKDQLAIQKEAMDRAGKLDVFVESDDHFHEILVGASLNTQFIEIIGNMRGRIKFLARRSFHKENRCSEALAEHLRVVKYLENNNGSGAYEAIKAHFDNACRINVDLID